MLTKKPAKPRSPFFCLKPLRSKMPNTVSCPSGSCFSAFSSVSTHKRLLSSKENSPGGRRQSCLVVVLCNAQCHKMIVIRSQHAQAVYLGIVCVSWLCHVAPEMHRLLQMILAVPVTWSDDLMTMTGWPLTSLCSCRYAFPVSASLATISQVMESALHDTIMFGPMKTVHHNLNFQQVQASKVPAYFSAGARCM